MDPFQIDRFSNKKTTSLDAEQLIRIVPSGILQLTCNNGKINMYYASDGYFDIIGYSKKEYRTLDRYKNGNLPLIYRNVKEVMASLAKCLKSEDHKILIDLSLDHKDGYIIWLRAEGIAKPTGPNCYDIQCSLTDISDIKALQSALEKEKDRYRVIIENSEDITFEYDILKDYMVFGEGVWEDGVFKYINLEVPQYLKALKTQNMVHPKDIKKTRQLVLGEIPDAIEVRLTRPDESTGKYYWKLIQAKNVRTPEGAIIQTVGVIRDIDEQKKRELSLVLESRKDVLTGLCNKDWSAKTIDNALQTRFCFRRGILVLADIDGFKAVNDNLGHVFGDAILKGVGEDLLKQAGSEDILGRIGGDEFVLFIPDIEENQIGAIADKVRDVFAKQASGKKQTCNISCSLGVSVYPQDGKTYQTLLDKADMALNAAKLHGSGNWYRYNTDVGHHSYLRRHATDIDQADYSKSHISFENSVLTSIFEILYETKDQSSAMTLILGILGRYLGVDHVAIFEKQIESDTVENTYLWCVSEDVRLVSEAILSREEDKSMRNNFDSNGVLKIDDTGILLPKESNEVLKKHVGSGFYKELTENGWFMGYLCMTNCTKAHHWTDEEYDFLIFVSKIIASCLRKMQVEKENLYENQMAQVIVNSQSIKSYIINPETYELLFAGSSLKAERPGAVPGTLCYEAVMGKKAPCASCRIKELGEEAQDCQWQRYTGSWNSWLNFQSHIIKWHNCDKAVIVAFDDISNFVDDILYIDKLTGISTLSRFEVDGADLFEHINEDAYALITFDVDEFRYINEFHGYNMGNQMLRYIAGGLVNSLEDGEICARVTGDVFVALIKWVDFETLDGRIKAFMTKVNNRLESLAKGLRLNFQFGVYPLKKDEKDIGQMMDNADIARKSIKGSRKSGIVLYDKHMGDKILKTRQIESRMEQALKDHEFLVYLQPKIDLASAKVVGAEALARWVDDQGQLVLPGEFIPIFEINGFIVELDFYVYEEVFKNFRYRKTRGLKCLPISVNMSRVHLKTGNYIERFCGLAQKYGVDPGLVEVEITETIFMENSQYVKRLVSDLHQYGFHVSVDDFGSGYSALNLLSEIDIDILKIDRSLCREENLSPKERIILKNIAAMAKELNLHVLAEGIETANQAEFLKSIHCDSAQGFLFARPMPMDEFYQKLDGEW